jgi:hypothetical protein
VGSDAAELEVRHERYGEASQVVCEEEELLERRIGAEVGWLVGAGACDECRVEDIDEVRDRGVAKEAYAQV